MMKSVKFKDTYGATIEVELTHDNEAFIISMNDESMVFTKDEVDSLMREMEELIKEIK